MMNTNSNKVRYFYEKFKTVLLISLLILCIVQVGILWSGQSGSFPISLFASKNASTVPIGNSESEYLLPYRVVISTGFDKDHYIIPNGSNEYKTLWEGAKLYIAQALETKPKQIQSFKEDERETLEDAWGTLVANKPYTFEFKTAIPIDIVKWIILKTDIKTPTDEGLLSIHKVVICPNDSDNNHSDTLYIRDDKSIYTYELKDSNDTLNQEVFTSIYKKMDINKKYQMAIEKFRNNPISQDLLGIFSGKRQVSYPNITCEAINGLNENEYTIDNFNNMARDLFGNERNDYEFDKDVNGSVVFEKEDGVYRLYKNSVLEYKYTGNQGYTQAKNVLEAYKTAIAFLIENRKQNGIMSGISVYLNSYKEEQGTYIFNFDYSISLGEGKGEIPIFLKKYEVPYINKPLSNCISIEASSKKVIHFEWLALKFNVEDNPKPYEWNFEGAYQKIYETNTELKGKEFSVKDFGIYYVLNDPKKYEQVAPSFVLHTNDGIYDVLMEPNNK